MVLWIELRKLKLLFFKYISNTFFKYISNTFFKYLQNTKSLYKTLDFKITLPTAFTPQYSTEITKPYSDTSRDKYEPATHKYAPA